MRTDMLISVVLHLIIGTLLISFRLSIAADPSQLISGLQGQPSSVSFRQYAGRVTVNHTHGRALFYWFFEADRHRPAKLPLALWLNGGPGCSSVGNGALSELGPFTTNNAGDGLVINKHSWTKAANIIFLESPYGTGFSYSNTSSDYLQYSDEVTAEDAYSFLLGWFKKFPEYKPNEFYLIGESYAGHYIPNLARLIVLNNKRSPGSRINFKGFAIGNAWTDAYYDNFGTTQFYHSHSLISDETFAVILANCDFAKDLPVDSFSANQTCNKAVDQANQDMDKIDQYNIYGLSCNSDSSTIIKKSAYSLTAAYNPCLDSVAPYLNLQKVQRSLHVTPSVHWSGCSPNVYRRYRRQDIVESMLPVYRQLLKEGLRIWIYSGDVDGVVATSGTRLWIKKLKLPVEVPWYAWNFKNQVGGWTQKYKGLTFVTVRGAGHLVPATRPAQALVLFRSFLAGKMMPAF